MVGSQEQMLEEVMEKVASQVSENIKEVVTASIETELTGNMTRALLESEFYRRLSDDMRFGLQSIYKQIKSAAEKENGGLSPSAQTEANKLFSEASEQLDEVRITLEEATNNIMDVLEQQMEMRVKATEHLQNLASQYGDNQDVTALIGLEESLGENLTQILTTMSFQDITGQRIKKIIAALQSIESTVFDLYMSTGLIIKAHEETPDKEFHEIEAETKQVVSELKGPSRDASQADVDDLLAQLGLD